MFTERKDYNKVITVKLVIPGRCNAKCPFCYNKDKQILCDKQQFLDNFIDSLDDIICRIGDKNPFFGKLHSETTKMRIGTANSIPVIQLNLGGNIISEFPSAKEAARTLGKPRADSEIIKVCKKYVSPSGRHYITALGYKWEYKEGSTTSKS